jgi:hypothetical protein
MGIKVRRNILPRSSSVMKRWKAASFEKLELHQCTRIHGVIFQQNVILILPADRPSDLTNSTIGKSSVYLSEFK